MPAPRCTDCNKFVGIEYNDNYSQVDLEVDGDGCPTGEYTIEFDCTECGATLKTGTMTFEMNDTPEDIAEYIENYVTDEKIEAAKADYLARIAKEGTEINEDTLRDEMDLALYSHNFSIEECSVEVDEKFMGKAKYYDVTINAHITDDDNPEWEGSDVVLSSDIAYADLEDY